jgi:hypothetical protein
MPRFKRFQLLNVARAQMPQTEMLSISQIVLEKKKAPENRGQVWEEV